MNLFRLIRQWLLPLAVAVLLLPLSSLPVEAKQAEKPISVFVLDKQIHPAVAPIYRYGHIYVELRSVAQALGYKIQYDAKKKTTTLKLEDDAYVIDQKSKGFTLNGFPYFDSKDDPWIILSANGTFVKLQLFDLSDYWQAEYDAKVKKVAVSAFGKPLAADFKSIQSVIDSHYREQGASEVSKPVLEGWGTFVAVSTDASIPKKGDELLDRVEHATILMQRESGGRWTIYDIQSDTEYVDYKSLGDREAETPQADKAEILSDLKAHYEAMNQEDADKLIAMRSPEEPLPDMISSLEELNLVLRYEFLHASMRYGLEKATIVAYQPDIATVYVETTLYDADLETEPHFRWYGLLTFRKASDGHWYHGMENDEATLGSEKF